jgi:hypothetical protein
MKWYLVKMVYQIICGDGRHTPQFDEQLRLIVAGNGSEAFDKAVTMGMKEQESFLNQKNELVQWQFVNVPEVYRLSKLIDGAEIYSRINEVEDAEAYTTFVHSKAGSIQDKQIQQLQNLI